ncbi:MAG: MFS transporter [Mycobacteriales bacterium]
MHVNGSVLRRPGMGRLTGALLLSNSADQFTQVALLWYVLSRTGSAALVGVVVLCAGLPAVLTAPLAGRLLDRGRPSALVAADNLARAGLLAAVPALAGLGLLTVPVLVLLALAGGALAPLTYSGTRVLLPRLVADAELPAANGVLSVGDQLPYAAGPAVAGFVVARTGAPVALLLPAAGLVAAALLVRGVRPPATDRPAEPSAGRLGFGVLWEDRALRALLVLSATYYLAYGPLEPALPVYVRHQLGAGAAAYGVLWGVFGAGALAGLALVRPLGRLRPGVVNALGAVAWGLLVAPMALVHRTPVAFALFFCGAVAWAPYTALEMTVLQRRVPPDRLGAAIGARKAVLVAASPAGAALGGLVTTPRTAPLVIAASAAACAVAGLGCLLSRDLRAVPGSPPAR